MDIEAAEKLAQRLAQVLRAEGLMLATAESCTGGWIAQMLTSQAGSSEWFERGFVTYSNAAKEEMLGVAVSTLAQWGAVSEQTATEMVRGALAHSRAQAALAVTGIAGPSGGSADKPVGTVVFAWAVPGGKVRTVRRQFSGDRRAVRAQSVVEALRGMLISLGVPDAEP
jgi:nicotinamide-nucleotide amidase